MKNRFPKRAIHLDFHTMPRVHDVGIDFDAADSASTLQKAGVDYVTIFAKCNLGFAYFPTKVGTVHPGMKTEDMVGPIIDECHKRNIQAAVYLSAGLDHEHALRNREWCRVSKEGQVYKTQQMGNFFRTMCLNTGYRDHLLAMIEEVLVGYPVDGLFLDNFYQAPCYGVECLDAMKQRDMDIFDDRQVKAFCSIMTDEFLDEVLNQIRKISPGINVYFNGIRYRRQPTQIELEVLPTGSWGYDYLPFVIRYARTLNKPYFTMTGRFHKSWGDMGGIRTGHSLLFDCFNSVANGGTCSIGDHMHPRGKLDPAVYDLVGKTYNAVSRIEPWTDDAAAAAEIVVIDPILKLIPGNYNIRQTQGHSLQGAARALSELKHQFDLTDGDADFTGYRIAILPDDVPIDDDLGESLSRFLEQGGYIISSSFSGLDPEKNGFVLPQYRIDYEGPEPYTHTFFSANPEVNEDLPQMLTAIYEPGIAMKPRDGSQVLAALHKPYFNHMEWDLYHEQFYCPPEKDSGRAALLRSGNVFHFSFPIFRNYIHHAAVPYRTLLRNCINLCLPNPLLKVENLPSFAQATITEKPGLKLVHLLLYVPELRGKSQMVEDPVVAVDVVVSLRTDGFRVKKAYLAPSRQPLDVQEKAGYAAVHIPKVSGYQLVAFEV